LRFYTDATIKSENVDIVSLGEEVIYLGEEKFGQPSGNSLSYPSDQLRNSGFVTKKQLKELVDFFKKPELIKLIITL
jgi:hypothetical protein